MGLLDFLFDDRSNAPQGGAEAQGGLLSTAAPARPAGLLGTSWDDPRTAASLNAAIGLLTPTTRRRGVMEGLAQAMGAYQSTLSDGRRQQESDQFKQLQQRLALQQAQRQAEQQKRQQDFLTNLPSLQMQGAQTALSGGGGPTVDNAARMPAVDPHQAQLLEAVKAGAMPYGDYLNATRKDNTPVKLGPGDSLVDVRAGKTLFTNPKEDTPPSDWKLFQLSGAQQRGMTFDQWDTNRRQASRPSVSVDMRGDNAYAAAQGKEYSEMMAGLNKAGFTAPSQLRKLERMTQLLDGVDGGKLAPLGMDIASAANGLGIKLDPKLGNKEAAQALSREIAGGFRQPGTGPTTDKDFDNFLMQVPDLSKTAAGRKQITTTMRAALNRDMKMAQLARAYERKHGRIDGGFLDEAAAFVAENPVVAAPAGWTVQR